MKERKKKIKFSTKENSVAFIVVQDGVSRDNDTIGRPITNYLPLDPFLPRSEPCKPRTWTEKIARRKIVSSFFLFFSFLFFSFVRLFGQGETLVVKRLNWIGKKKSRTYRRFRDQ